MQPDMSSVVSSCFYHLRRMKSSLKLLLSDTARSVVNTLVISRIDYCNSLLANSSQPESTPARDECSSATCLSFWSANTRILSAARHTSLAARAWASRVQALSSGLQSCPWHCTRISHWALPIKRWRHWSFSTPLGSTRRSPRWKINFGDRAYAIPVRDIYLGIWPEPRSTQPRHPFVGRRK